jgi:hypothetical protein
MVLEDREAALLPCGWVRLRTAAFSEILVELPLLGVDFKDRRKRAYFSRLTHLLSPSACPEIVDGWCAVAES